MQLSHRTWLQLHHFIAASHLTTDSEQLKNLTLQELPQLLPVDYLTWNEHAAALEITHFESTSGFGEPVVERVDQLAQTMPSHPILRNLGMTEKFDIFKDVHSIHDFTTDREFRETPIFQEVYRHADANYQLSCHIHFAAHYGVLLAANSRRPISESARFKLEILKTHLAIAGQRHLAINSLDTRFAHHCGQPALDSLTPRERETLTYLLQGKTTPEIAIIFDRSPRTVEKYVNAILKKLGFENRGALIAGAKR